MNLGIDLDDTIIDLSIDSFDWMIKRDALEVLKRLIDDGYQLIIITARSKSTGNCHQISMIIDELSLNEIKIKDVIFTSGRAKGSYAKNAGCTHMIDDNQIYLRDCHEYGVIPVLYRDWYTVYSEIQN